MASSAVNKLWITIRDNAGRIAKTAVQLVVTEWDPAGTVAQGIKGVILAVLAPESQIVKMSIEQTETLDGTATAAPRANREDKITMDLPDANGVVHTFRMPTPSTALSATLGSDKLNILNTSVLAWVSAMTSHALTADGVSYEGTITGGRYIRHKSEKKGGY
jgi:hypothetical protein